MKRCKVCGNKVDKCDYCGEEFYKNQWIICFDGEHYCDEVCLALELVERAEASISEAVMVNGTLRCKLCGQELNKCDDCIKHFSEGSEVICLHGYGIQNYHFCSDECLEDFLLHYHKHDYEESRVEGDEKDE